MEHERHDFFGGRTGNETEIEKLRSPLLAADIRAQLTQLFGRRWANILNHRPRMNFTDTRLWWETTPTECRSNASGIHKRYKLAPKSRQRILVRSCGIFQPIFCLRSKPHRHNDTTDPVALHPVLFAALSQCDGRRRQSGSGTARTESRMR